MTNRPVLSILFFLVSASYSNAQPPAGDPSDIKIGNAGNIYSQTLKENRRFFVSLPGSANDTYFYKRRYPVVYLLDAESHFFSVTAMIKQLSEANGATMFPEMIVVGILNTDRNRDLTPTRVKASPVMDSATARRTGGGDNFLSFVSDELMPHIDSLYPTAPYRIFIGHSLGGLTVMHTLIHHPSLFNAYIAIDPSMSWDDGRLLHEARTRLKFPPVADKSLFLGIANSTHAGMPPTPSGADSLMIRLSKVHYQSILTLRDYLTANGSHSGLRSSWKYYPDYDHSAVPLPAEYDGLRFLFNYYDLDFQFPRFLKATTPADTAIEAHYQVISRQMGYKVSPPEPFINNLAYNLLNLHQLARAYRLFMMNVENYPNSFNVYDSLGDYYDATGDKEKAMSSYRQALALRENPETREKLNKMQANK